MLMPEENPSVENTVLEPATKIDSSNSQPKKSYSKVLLGVVVLMLVLSAVGVYLLLANKNSTLDKNQTAITSPTPTETTITPTPTIDYGVIDTNIANWKTFSLKTIGMEFKLPTQISDKLGNLQETTNIVEEVSGLKMFCFIEYQPGPYGKLCGNSMRPINFEATSNFDTTKTSIARELALSDILGYKFQNGKYYFRTAGDDGINTLQNQIADFANPKEIINPNGVHILKVHGRTDPSGSIYFFPTGYVGAILITKDLTFPVLTIYTNLTTTFTETVFDQILSTFNYSK